MRFAAISMFTSLLEDPFVAPEVKRSAKTLTASYRNGCKNK